MQKDHVRLKIECNATRENEYKILHQMRKVLADVGLKEAGVSEVITAVTEAIGNIIVHAYPGEEGLLRLELRKAEDGLTITVEDDGVGIEDVEKAKEAFFTTKPKMERSGMGFSFMTAFMNEVNVVSQPGKGTSVCMRYICQI